jgi:hypothetical protein
MKGFVLTCALAAAVSGCGGDIGGFSARDSCFDIWGSVCTRYYACYSPQDIAEAGLPPTVEGCRVQLGNNDCGDWSSNSCMGGLVFHPPAVPDCQAEIEGLSCDLIADAPGTAPSCTAVCTAQ